LTNFSVVGQLKIEFGHRQSTLTFTAVYELEKFRTCISLVSNLEGEC